MVKYQTCDGIYNLPSQSFIAIHRMNYGNNHADITVLSDFGQIRKFIKPRSIIVYVRYCYVNQGRGRLRNGVPVIPRSDN